MLNRLIIFLIRRRLGIGPSEYFRFTNQKSNDIYYFDSKQGSLIKLPGFAPHPCLSGVSLNWLLSDECKIEKV
jgi:hypothetical protein